MSAPAPVDAPPPGAAPPGASLAPRRRRAELLPAAIDLCGATTVLLLAGIVAVVTLRSGPAVRQFGLGFLWGRQWNPITDNYGALPLIYGTLLTSALALLLAAPFGLGIAILLSEDLLPARLRWALGFIVELLAAIPSVVYGLWGIATVIPLTTLAGRWLHAHGGGFPLFSTPPVGPGVLPASLVLGVMVLPTIAALSRSSLLAVPRPQAEGAYALGATRWQVLFAVALPNARTGIFAAVVLALGRAMGETMALAMLVGNNNRISASLLAPGNTIASLLANSFGEASGVELSALMYLSFVLLAMTLVVNLFAQGLLARLGGHQPSTG